MTNAGGIIVTSASVDSEGESHGLPTIIADHRLEAQSEEAALSLTLRKGIYQRYGQLVRVVEDSNGLIREKGGPIIEPIPLETLHLILSSCADWRAWRKIDGEMKLVHTTPPDKVVRGVHKMKRYPAEIPELEAVIETPMILSDGRVVQSPGYDEESRLLYLEPDELRGHSVPDEPSRADVEDARDLLLDLICDFRFQKEAHRSAFLAGILSYFARFAIKTPCPCFIVDANTPGSGKGYLVKLVGTITQNRWLDRFTQKTDPKDEEQMIVSIAQSGLIQVLLDNVDRPIGSGAFDGALTDTTISDRAYHTQKISRFPLFAIWWITGNNVQIREGADTARRAAHVRLDSPEERPEQRTGFKHDPLLDYAREMRPQLVMACLTILRGYFVAGRPRMKLKRWGGFEEWSDLIRNCVVWCGLADPYEAHEALVAEADTDSDVLEDLLTGFKDMQEYYKCDSLTLAEVVAELECEVEQRKKNAHYDLRFPLLFHTLLKLCSVKDGKVPTAHLISKRITKYKGRVRKGMKLVTFEKSKLGMRWGVVCAEAKVEA